MSRPALLLPSGESVLPPPRPSTSAFPFVDHFATYSSGGGESDFAGTPDAYLPLRPAGAWNRKELGFLKLASWGGREGFASVVLRLGSWLFRSDFSLFTQ